MGQTQFLGIVAIDDRANYGDNPEVVCRFAFCEFPMQLPQAFGLM